MQISIVIVNWNARRHLCDCLSSIMKQSRSGVSLEVIVVDNASTDDSAPAVRRMFPDLKLIENTENVGFARANNQGIQLAQGEFVLLLNPDTIVLDNSLMTLLQVMRSNPQIGIVGPRLVNQDGSIQPSVMKFPSLSTTMMGFMRRRLRGGSKILPPEGADVCYVACVSGACLMVRRVAFGDVGLLDESYLMYGEDLDFCYRVSRAGWNVAYTPVASIVHLGGQSTKQAPERMYVERRKGRIRFLLVHRGRFQAAMAALLIEGNLILRCLASPGRHRRSAFRRILSLYHDAVYPMIAEGRPDGRG